MSILSFSGSSRTFCRQFHMHPFKHILFSLIAAVVPWNSMVAQEIRITSRADDAPLPYATVVNRNQGIITSADVNGKTQLAAAVGDTLSISYVGYRTAVLRFSGQKELLIRLTQEQRTLPEVMIHHCSRTQEFNFSNFETEKSRKRKNRANMLPGGVIWSKGPIHNSKIAVLVKPQKTYATLKSFSFWIEKYFDAPESWVRTPVLISLYEVLDSSGLPGAAVSEAPIIYYPKEKGKQTVRIDSLHVSVPLKGIYVGLQYVMNEEYKWNLLTKRRGQDSVLRDTTIIMYGGVMVGTHTVSSALAYYNGIEEKWSYLPPPSPGQPPMAVKCAATIEYCEE